VKPVTMPLNRSPRAHPPTSRSCILQHSDSEPNLNLSADNDYINTAMRKRKHGSDFSEELSSIQDRFAGMIASLQSEQNSKLSALLETVGVIQKQNEDIKDSIKFMSDKYDTLLLTVQSLQEENKFYLRRIEVLEDKIEGLERSAHVSRVELRNVPKVDRETKDDLINVMIKSGEILGKPIQRCDVKDIFRINTKNDKNNPIVTVFTSNITKEQFMTKVKDYNRSSNGKKLTSADISVPGPPVPIFISDNLPQKVRQLYAAARTYRKENHYTFCWTSAGRVFLKKNEHTKPILIKTLEDLRKLTAL
jgi:hypothetical protein